MTVTTDRSNLQQVVVSDQHGPLSFYGEVLVDLSWSYAEAEARGFPRWTDITLYRVNDPESQYRYVVQVMGRSVVYHKPGSPCRRGMSVPVGILRRDVERYDALVVCEKRNCQPADLDDLDDTAMVAVEEPIPTLYKCTDAADLVREMEERSGAGNNLSLKLIQRAAFLDSKIAMVMAGARGL